MSTYKTQSEQLSDTSRELLYRASVLLAIALLLCGIPVRELRGNSKTMKTVNTPVASGISAQ